MEESQQPAARANESQGDLFQTAAIEVVVTLNLAKGIFDFDWVRPGEDTSVANGTLAPRLPEGVPFRFLTFTFQFQPPGIGVSDHCGVEPVSIHALMRR